jgi:Fe2+ or Zn2+ uptake regulation protein
VTEADLHALVGERLAAADQRYTANRRAVVEVLEATLHPLTIPEIVARRTGLATSSAYRNLAVLEETGVVHRILSTDEFARYELAEDLTDHHHHHLICTGCGSVTDFTAPDEVEQSLAAALDQVAASSGFQAENHRLDLVGRCRRCA